MNQTFRKNLSVLKTNHPMAYRAVMDIVGEDFPGRVVYNDRNMANLMIQKDGREYAMHTESDMAGSVDGLGSIPKEKHCVVVLMGMGLGYSVKAMLDHLINIQKVIVFESESWIFRLALETRDMSHELSDPRFIIGLGHDPDIRAVLKPAERSIQVEDIHMMTHVGLTSLWPDVYNALRTAVFEQVNNLNIEGGTVSHHGKDMMSNRLSLLSAVRHNQMLENLVDLFKGVAAFIVAAGPSLDENMEVLRQAQGRGVIICVDTVFPSLMKNGIKPDFVTCIDFLEVTYEKISGAVEAFKGVSLICLSAATWKVPKLIPADQVYWCFMNTPMDKWICNGLGGELLTPGMGTVAHLNLIAATLMGCSQIIFVGQDLAYRPDQSYAENVVLSTHDDIKKKLASNNPDDIIWVENNAGKKVPTSRQFLGHIRTFEAIIEKNVSQPCYNTSLEGARIRGTEVLSLEQAIDQFCAGTYDTDRRLKAIATEQKGPDVKGLISRIEKLGETIREIRAMVLKADKGGREVLTKLRKKSTKKVSGLNQLPKKIQQGLVRIDQVQKALDSRTDFWPLLDEITVKELKQTDRMKMAIARIEGRPEKYNQWLTKSLERLSFVNEKRLEILDYIEGEMNKTTRHLAEEDRLLKRIEDGEGGLEEIVTLYFESGDLVLATPYLERWERAGEESAALFYYLGMMAAHRLDFEKADHCFARALQWDPELSTKIRDFKSAQGTKYLLYASYYKGLGRSTFVTMLMKGVWYMPDNGGIRLEIQQLVDEDLNGFQIALEKGLDPGSENASWIMAWKDNLEKGMGLEKTLGADRTARIFQYCGMYLTAAKDYLPALELMEKAHAIAPGNAEILIQICDLCLAQNLFDRGLSALHRAVAIDRQMGQYWENLGDNLAQSRDFANAARAYENCFKALPENTGVGMKLADTLRQLGEKDRADAVLQQSHSGGN